VHRAVGRAAADKVRGVVLDSKDDRRRSLLHRIHGRSLISAVWAAVAAVVDDENSGSVASAEAGSVAACGCRIPGSSRIDAVQTVVRARPDISLAVRGPTTGIVDCCL
jgi:hypothetical protein